MTKCGAKKRQGSGKCTQPAGWGTDHRGEGKCKLHGGASRPKHGRYSTVKHGRIRELYEKFEADPDPLNLLPELAQVRAILVDFVERYDKWKEAFLAWHESFHTGDGIPKPRQVMDIADARNTVLAIARVVEVIERVKGNVSRSDLMRIMTEMGRAVDHEVQDEETRQRIKNRWMEVRIA